MKTLLNRASITAKLSAVTLSATAISSTAFANDSVTALTEAAKQEGAVYSVGMPDSWANWKDTWNDLKSDYGLKHQDTDMSSAQEIAKFEAEKKMQLPILAMSVLRLLEWRFKRA